MRLFVTIANNFQPLNIVTKNSSLVIAGVLSLHLYYLSGSFHILTKKLFQTKNSKQLRKGSVRRNMANKNCFMEKGNILYLNFVVSRIAYMSCFIKRNALTAFACWTAELCMDWHASLIFSKCFSYSSPLITNISISLILEHLPYVTIWRLTHVNFCMQKI